MKKYIYLIPLFIIPIFIKKNVEVVIENSNEEVIFYYNDLEIIGIKMEAFDINDMFNLMSIKSNSSQYKTCLNLNNTLSDYQIKDNDLYLYSKTNENIDSYKQIYMTFIYMGFDNVYYNDLRLDCLINPLGIGNYKTRVLNIINDNYYICDYLSNNSNIENVFKLINVDVTNYIIDDKIDVYFNQTNENDSLIIYKTLKFNTKKDINLIVNNE